MREIPSEDLEAVMERAGYSDRQKKKLRDANKPPTTTRGHGAPTLKSSIDLDEI